MASGSYWLLERVPLKNVAVLEDWILSSTLNTFWKFYWSSLTDESSLLEIDESLSISQASSSSLEEKNEGFPNNYPAVGREFFYS